MRASDMKRRATLSACLLCSAFAIAMRAAADEAPDYASVPLHERPASWGFSLPEDDARPGLRFFHYAVDALEKGQYGLAIDMYEASASWAYKPAAYNLGVMYLHGEGTPIDRPRAMAWMAIAAERGDAHYVEARELVYASLSEQEFARANEIWRELKKTYADAVAMPRAKMRWAQVRAAMTGSRVGSPGALRIAGMQGNPRNSMPGSTSAIAGALGYRQLIESADPYDEAFQREPAETIEIGEIEPLRDVQPPPGER